MVASLIITQETVAISIGAVGGALTRYQCGRIFGEWIAAADTVAAAAARPAAGVGTNRRAHHLAGWHTAFINIAGSFLLGGIAAAPSRTDAASSSSTTSTTKSIVPNSTWGLTPRLRLMLGVGFCGSFTTFSTYSVDIVTWIAQGNTSKALSYVMVNNVGGVVAAAAGMALVKKLFG